MKSNELPPPPDIRAALEKVAEHGVPDSLASRILDVGTSGYLDYFQTEILDDILRRGAATARFIEGPYGSGKTHLLRLLHHIGMQRRMAVAWTDLSQAVSLEDWRQVTTHVLERIEAQLAGETVRSLPGILEALGREGCKKIDDLRSGHLPHPGFQSAMFEAVRRSASGEPPNQLLDRYLLGERIGSGQLAAVGIKGVKHPLSRRNALQALNTVLTGLFRLGLPGVMLLFDENETTLQGRNSTPSRSTQIAANLIRRLIDACTTGDLHGTVIVFGVLPGFLERCAAAYPALGQRLHLVRRSDVRCGWRWPVLPIHALSTTDRPEAFLAGAIDRFEEILTHCGVETVGLRSTLRTQGETILEAQAGGGYRRAMIKLFATLACERFPEGKL